TPPAPFNSPKGGPRVYFNPYPLTNVYYPHRPHKQDPYPTHFDRRGDEREWHKYLLPPSNQEIGFALDQHGEEGFNPDWTGTLPVSYTTRQQYQWRADNVNNGNWQDIGGTIDIVRTVRYVTTEDLHLKDGRLINDYVYTIHVISNYFH